MSVSQPESGTAVLPDFSSMTEEEQIAYAMQMSLAGGGGFHSLSQFILHSTLGMLDNCFLVNRVWRDGNGSANGRCRISQGQSFSDSVQLVLVKEKLEYENNLRLQLNVFSDNSFINRAMHFRLVAFRE